MAGRSRWVRLDVNYFSHPKVLAAGRDGRDLHLAAICYSAHHRTDGHLAPEVMNTILLSAGVKQNAIDLAVAAGLLTPNGHGWVVHDFLDHQESREEGLAAAERARAGGRERQRRFRERHA